MNKSIFVCCRAKEPTLDSIYNKRCQTTFKADQFLQPKCAGCVHHVITRSIWIGLKSSSARREQEREKEKLPHSLAQNSSPSASIALLCKMQAEEKLSQRGKKIIFICASIIQQKLLFLSLQQSFCCWAGLFFFFFPPPSPALLHLVLDKPLEESLASGPQQNPSLSAPFTPLLAHWGSSWT